MAEGSPLLELMLTYYQRRPIASVCLPEYLQHRDCLLTLRDTDVLEECFETYDSTVEDSRSTSSNGAQYGSAVSS